MISTRDFVLYILKTADEFVSGESISERMGISRAAVNTAVKALRNDGYEIESITNKGYRLIGGSETLCLGEMLEYTGTERTESINILEKVDSTNNYLKNLCAEGKAKEGSCVIADCQTKGKGRRGRRFESKSGVGVYLSYVLDAKGVDTSKISEITAWGAVAVREAIEEVCGVSCGIKWVNDIIFEGMKICGILTELSVEAESGNIQNIIMGIGINVNNDKSDFPKEIQNIASSLKIICGREISRAALCAAVIRHLDRLCADFPENRKYYLEQYRKNCVITGREITVVRGENERKGTALGIDEHFGLEVKYDNGDCENVIGGEVSVKGIYGVK